MAFTADGFYETFNQLKYGSLTALVALSERRVLYRVSCGITSIILYPFRA
jgi:hypothetical protein